MNIETKQKVMISFILVALVILVWQVMLLMRGDANDAPQSSSAPTLAAASNSSAMINKSQPFPVATVAINKADNQAANSLAAPAIAPPISAPGIPQPLNTAQTSNVSGANVDPAVAANQQQYLQLVTEYQMVQIQRMIAEDEEAIAIAKSNAAKAVASTVQLAGGSPSTVTSVMPATTNSDDYELIFTGQQGDQWTATVKKDGQLYDIVVGSKLPDDSQVLAIDDNGVLLSQGDTKKLITFSGVSLIGAQPAANQHSDLSGVTANNEINGNVNNSNSYADNSSESNQAGLVQNSNASKVAGQNGDQANVVVDNSNESNSNLPNSNVANVYAQNSVTSVQSNNVTNSNAAAVNKSKSIDTVVASSVTGNQLITNTPPNVADIKKAPTNSIANISATAPVINKAPINNIDSISAAVPVIKKVPTSSVANISAAVPAIKKVPTSSVANISTAVPVIKKAPINNIVNISSTVPVINKTPSNAVANSSATASIIKKVPTNSAANIPAAVPVIGKISSSTLAVNTLSAASNKQEIKSVSTGAQLSMATVQAKTINTPFEEIPTQIAKANSASYTIQLIADDHMGPLTNYVRENNLQNKAVPLLTHRWGKDWYILVYGQYKSAAEANAAIRQLPKIAMQWGPFVRRIGDVQNMVNNAIDNHSMVGGNYTNSTS